MANYDESDSAYVRGRIGGYLRGLVRASNDDLAFDRQRWEEQYGNRVVYESFPAWASTEERKRNADPVVLCDWKESTETLYLKEGVSLPRDRSGEMVFEDGTVVIVSSGFPQMFDIDEADVELIEQWREVMIDMLRGTYGYDGN